MFDGFRSKYLNLTEKTYLSESDFKNFNDFADVYVSGSDQVWNFGWNKGVIPCFYLDFAPDGKPQYAYASAEAISTRTKSTSRRSTLIVST